MNKQKVAIVTGGSNGLGKAIVEELVEKDYRVINLDIQSGLNRMATWQKCDVKNESDLKSVRNILRKMGITSIDLLVNNAGLNHLDYLENLEEKDFDRIIKTNVYGYFLVAKTFLPLLKIKNPGTIINIVSRAAKQPMTASLAYNASKGAQLIMTKQMARELTKRHGITVFGISPNRLEDTQMTKYINGTVPEVRGWTKEYAEKYQKKNTLVKGETKPKEVAEKIVYLVESKHDFLSGSNLEFGI